MKKNRIASSVVSLFLVLGMVSCTSDGDKSTTESVGVSTGNYYPMAVGNQWTYQADGSASGTTQIYGTDKFNGTTYYRISGDEVGKDMGQAWITKKGAAYYQKTGAVNYTEDGSTVKMDGFEVVALRDDLDVNQTWTGTYNINMNMSQAGEQIMDMSMKVTYVGKILDRGLTETVNGVEYHDVIKASLEQTISAGKESTVVSAVSWYAKDIGLIRTIQESDDETTESILIDHVLK